MDYVVEDTEETGICTVRVSGDTRRPEDSRRLQKLALDIRSQKGIHQFLFDMRAAVIVGGTLGAYETGVEPSRQRFPVRDFRVALVYTGDLSDHKFMEQVVVNRGYTLRVFSAIDEAHAWLKTESGAA